MVDEASPLVHSYGTFQGRPVTRTDGSQCWTVLLEIVQLSFLILMILLAGVHLFIPFAMIYDTFAHESCWSSFYIYSEMTWLSTTTTVILLILILAREDVLRERQGSPFDVGLWLPGVPFLGISTVFVVGGMHLLLYWKTNPCASSLTMDSDPSDMPTCAETCPTIYMGIGFYVSTLSLFLGTILILLVSAPPFHQWLPALFGLDEDVAKYEAAREDEMRKSLEEIRLVRDAESHRILALRANDTSLHGASQSFAATCCICLDDFEVQDANNASETSAIVQTRSCHHTFHSDCIRNWFHRSSRRRRLTCPLCRQTVTSSDS